MRKIITSALVLALAAVLAPATAAADGSVCPPGYGHHEFNGIDNCTAPGSVNGQYPWEAWRDYGQPQGDPQPGPEVEQPVGDPQPRQQPQGDPLGTPEVEQAQPGQGVESGPEAQPQQQPAIVEVPQPVEVPERREPREPQAQTGGGCRVAVLIHHRNIGHTGFWQATGCIDAQTEQMIDEKVVVPSLDDGVMNGWVWAKYYDLNHLGEFVPPTCDNRWESTRTGEDADRYATGGMVCVPA